MSGLKSIYKIYVESFKDREHLNAIVSEAQAIVKHTLDSSEPDRGSRAERQ